MKTRLVCALCFAVAALAALASPAPAKPPVELELLGVKKVWDKAPHNAFTDLVRFKDKWYLTFREAASHMYTAPAGKIRVLVSDDGETWTSAALLKYGTDDDDLRDSKLSVMPDGRLLLICALAPKEDHATRQSYAYTSENGTDWKGPVKVGEFNWWLWRVVWSPDGTAYGLAYDSGAKRFEWTERLYRSKDGLHYETFLPQTHAAQGGQRGGDAVSQGRLGGRARAPRHRSAQRRDRRHGQGRLARLDVPRTQAADRRPADHRASRRPHPCRRSALRTQGANVDRPLGSRGRHVRGTASRCPPAATRATRAWSGTTTRSGSATIPATKAARASTWRSSRSGRRTPLVEARQQNRGEIPVGLAVLGRPYGTRRSAAAAAGRTPRLAAGAEVPGGTARAARRGDMGRRRADLLVQLPAAAGRALGLVLAANQVFESLAAVAALVLVDGHFRKSLWNTVSLARLPVNVRARWGRHHVFRGMLVVASANGKSRRETSPNSSEAWHPGPCFRSGPPRRAPGRIPKFP